MASQNTNIYAIQSGTPTALVASGQVHSTVPSVYAGAGDHVINGQHLTTSALTAGSHTLTLFVLPKGAKVNSLELIVPASVGTSSAKIGFSGDDDRYGSAVNLSTVGRKQFIIVSADAEYITTQEETVYLTPVTTDFATAITCQFICKYTVV